MLILSNLTYRIAGRTLFDQASAQIAEGHRVGLVGRNGAGKSTLLKLITGSLQVDGGSIDLPRNARIGMVAQEAPGGVLTPADVVLAADVERTHLLAEAETATDPDRIGEIHMRLADIDAHSAPARAGAILAGLGFDQAMQERPMSSFSGGWRMRVALAAALFAEPDILLLDEPTNHLDLEATVWLESYLKIYPRTLLLISHDRHILNEVVDHILHLDKQKLTYYPGGYDDSVRLRAAQIEQTKAAAAKLDARRKHLQSYVDRFRASATKARQAQSRLKAISRMGQITVDADDPTIAFNFPQPAEMAPPLIALDGVSIGYTEGKPVLSGLNMRIDPDDRIALLGANGNGKSTLAKLLAGRLAPMAGQQHRSNKLRCGFFAQHQIEDMRPEESPFDHLKTVLPNARELELRSRLGSFGFPGDKAFQKVKQLSGGERARLNFALITADAPPLLILDEPTNHLDIDSRAALADAINDYQGAVILVTHDWTLLELTADRLWLVSGGKVSQFDGDLEDYRRLMLGGARSDRNAGGGKNAGKKSKGGNRKSVEPFRTAAKIAELALEQATAQKARVEQRLSAANLSASDRTRLMREQSDLARAVAAAEEAWLEAQETLERAAAE